MTAFSGLDHIDIVVDDIDAMAAFYVSLGFAEIRRTDHNGGAIELRFPGGVDQPILELTPARVPGRPDKPLGLRHMALRCANLGTTIDDLRAAGHTVEGPKFIPHTGRTLANIADPAGSILQIVD